VNPTFSVSLNLNFCNLVALSDYLFERSFFLLTHFSAASVSDCLNFYCRPFYGFHSKEHQFFKIYFYNPLMVKKATELLQVI
jgi:hypothetical protein